MNTLEWALAIVAMIGAVWGGLWQVVRKLAEFRDWLEATIKAEVQDGTKTLRLNSSAGLADVPQRLDRIQASLETSTTNNQADHHEIRQQIQASEIRVDRIEHKVELLKNKVQPEGEA